MEPILASRWDRFRLIEILVRAARDRYPDALGAPKKQSIVALRARVSTATVNNIENLTQSLGESAAARGRAVRRKTLLVVLLNGLRLDIDRIDPILWLFDGHPLTESEITDYQPIKRIHGASGTVSHQVANPLRRIETRALQRLTLEQLREIVNEGFSHAGTQRASATIFSSDAQGRIDGLESLAKLEEMPGQRLILTNRPSHLVHRREYLLSTQMTDTLPDTYGDNFRREALVHLRRKDIFDRNINLHGERAIHSKSDLFMYMNDNNIPATMRSVRSQHIRNFITILRDNINYKYFWVGLIEIKPSLELIIKSMSGAFMRQLRTSVTHGFHQTPYAIFWNDKASVMQFYLSFEETWAGIPEIDKDRIHVADWLEDLLGRAGKMYDDYA